MLAFAFSFGPPKPVPSPVDLSRLPGNASDQLHLPVDRAADCQPHSVHCAVRLASDSVLRAGSYSDGIVILIGQQGTFLLLPQQPCRQSTRPADRAHRRNGGTSGFGGGGVVVVIVRVGLSSHRRQRFVVAVRGRGGPLLCPPRPARVGLSRAGSHPPPPVVEVCRNIGGTTIFLLLPTQGRRHAAVVGRVH